MSAFIDAVILFASLICADCMYALSVWYTARKRHARPEPRPLVLSRPCGSCERELPAGANFCTHCGGSRKLTHADECLNCFRAVEPEWILCPWCGKQLGGAYSCNGNYWRVPQKSRS